MKTGKILQSGSRATYRIPPRAVGARIRCDASVANAGGTFLAKTITTSRIKPEPRKKRKERLKA